MSDEKNDSGHEESNHSGGSRSKKRAKRKHRGDNNEDEEQVINVVKTTHEGASSDNQHEPTKPNVVGKIWFCLDHSIDFPQPKGSLIGPCSIERARELLDKVLIDAGLEPFNKKPYTLHELDITKENAILFCKFNPSTSSHPPPSQNPNSGVQESQ